MCEQQPRYRCIVCGKQLSDPYFAYCSEHRHLAYKDDKILQEAPMELLFSLIASIFVRARIDYMLDTEGQKSDAEVFFRSPWAQSLSLSQFDPEKVLKEMDEEIENGTDYLRGNTGRKKWQ